MFRLYFDKSIIMDLNPLYNLTPHDVERARHEFTIRPHFV